MAFKSVWTSGDTSHKSTENHSHNHISITCSRQQGKNSINILRGGGGGGKATYKKQGMAGSPCHSTNRNCWASTITHVCLRLTMYTRGPRCDTVTQHCILQMEKEWEHWMCIICHTIFTIQPKRRSRHCILCLQDQYFVDKTQNLDRTITKKMF